MAIPTSSGVRMPFGLRNFSLHINNIGYAGVVTKGKLPDVSIKTEDHRASGMEGNRKLDHGLEDMEATFSLAEFNDGAMKLTGILNGSNTELKFRGALSNDESPNAIPVEATIKGAIHKSEPGDWESGAKTEANFTVNCKFYELKVDGEEVFHIDNDNLIRRIGGEDQMESIRAAIKL